MELGTATRSGNKKVTLVNNLETYHIDPAQFGHKCQVRLDFTAPSSHYSIASRCTGLLQYITSFITMNITTPLCRWVCLWAPRYTPPLTGSLARRLSSR